MSISLPFRSRLGFYRSNRRSLALLPSNKNPENFPGSSLLGKIWGYFVPLMSGLLERRSYISLGSSKNFYRPGLVFLGITLVRTYLVVVKVFLVGPHLLLPNLESSPIRRVVGSYSLEAFGEYTLFLLAYFYTIVDRCTF